MKNILNVKNLNVSFRQGRGAVTLVDDLSFALEEGKCLGILGESGSGKSMTMKALLGLLDRNFSAAGEALFRNRDLLKLPKEDLRRIRGNEISVILQNPMSCFDPLCRIGFQMEETFREHRRIGEQELTAKEIETLTRMQIRNPEEVLKKYPHQLSGGMLQRIMIGLAVALEPKLLIADEPTTAIDSITQHEILKDLIEIKKKSKTSMIFITHDLGVISRIADEIIVMHKGRAVERGSMEYIMENSRDLYTQELVKSRVRVMERFDRIMNRDKSGRIGEIS